MALGQRHREESAFPLKIGPVIALGLIGASLVYGDGIITPAISVLSVAEGIEVETTAYQPYTLQIAIAVLVAFFAIKSRGSVDGSVHHVALVRHACRLGSGAPYRRLRCLRPSAPAIQFLRDHPTQGLRYWAACFSS